MLLAIYYWITTPGFLVVTKRPDFGQRMIKCLNLDQRSL